MNNAIFSFSKPAKGSTVVSNHLARFIAKVLDLPLYYDARIRDERLDILFIVNGAYAFCDCLADLAPAIRRAKRIVWIQNDYTIKPPRFDVECKAESPFRRAFVRRALAGKLPTDYWTTVLANATATSASRYVNWNSMTSSTIKLAVNREYTKDLFYYGAYRMQRGQSFDRYFTAPLKAVPVTVSSTSKKFAERYPDITVVGGLPRSTFLGDLGSHGLGLYIEDTKSHVEWHSPANRFYEMLSARLPMVFEPEAVPMLVAQGGIPGVADFVIERKADLIGYMVTRNLTAILQHDMWWRPYREELRHRLKYLYDNLLRRHHAEA